MVELVSYSITTITTHRTVILYLNVINADKNSITFEVLQFITHGVTTIKHDGLTMSISIENIWPTLKFKSPSIW